MIIIVIIMIDDNVKSHIEEKQLYDYFYYPGINVCVSKLNTKQRN